MSARERRWFWATLPSKTFLSALAADALTGTVLTFVGLPGRHQPFLGAQTLTVILGDRRRKTAIAIDTVLNQRDRNVVCVYCAIGQRASGVAKVVANLLEKVAMITPSWW